MVRLPPLPAGLSEALWLFLVLRVALSAVGLFAAGAESLPGPCHYELAQDHWRTVPPLSDQGAAYPLVGVWQRWDACWYSKIASFGYEPGENATAFFPLYPSLVRVASLLTTLGNVALAGIIVSSVAYVVGMAGLYRLVRQDFGRPVARRAVLYISVFPAAFFFFAPFTESLFAALTVWAIYFGRRRTWDGVALCGTMAALTRIQGVLLVFPIAWLAILAWRDLLRRRRAVRRSAEIGSGLIGADSPSVDRDPPSDGLAGYLGPGLAILSPVVGFAAFLLYSGSVVGQTPLDAQDLWGGRNFHPPWELIGAAWQWVLDKGASMEAVNLAVLVLFGVLLVAALRLLPFVYSAYAIPQYALVATRILPTPLTSTTRYMLVLFPAFVVLALVGRNRRLDTSWLVISILFLGALTFSFLRGDFVA